jgi:hypothetical protein
MGRPAALRSKSQENSLQQGIEAQNKVVNQIKNTLPPGVRFGTL